MVVAAAYVEINEPIAQLAQIILNKDSQCFLVLDVFGQTDGDVELEPALCSDSRDC